MRIFVTRALRETKPACPEKSPTPNIVATQTGLCSHWGKCDKANWIEQVHITCGNYVARPFRPQWAIGGGK